MSRLIVKNLPNYISDQRLKEHFSSQGGAITDVKLVHRPDGTSRRFAFVGFKTENDASKAKAYFDRTYIDSSKINVLIVDSSRALERPNKRQKTDASTKDVKGKKPATGTQTQPAPAEDSTLTEFLEVMKPRTKKERTWANEPESSSQAIPAPSTSTVVQDPSSSKTLPHTSNSTSISVDPTTEPDSIDDSVSDLEWMRRRMATSALDTDSAGKDASTPIVVDESGPSPTEEIPANSTEGDSIAELLEESPRLYLRNLAYSCTTSDLEEAFGKFGNLAQAHIPVDSRTQTPKGMGYVTFTNAESALAAQQAMHKSAFQGRILYAMPAVSRRTKPELEGQKSVKDTKLQKSKEMASKDFNWSMLYMNSDAVVSSVADRLKISKSDILNPDAGDAAVKLALAETHVIQETKKYLEDEGVLLDSFQTKKRSDTTILVKNIPYGTTLEELTEIFSPHGDIVRLLLPPAGTIAVVEFSNASEASKAFKSIAYRRLKNSIIYLEKAPLGIFKEGDPGTTKSRRLASGVKPVTDPANSKVVPAPEDTASADDSPSTTTAVAGATLFVKNLSFATTSEKLTKTFRHLASFAFARVQIRPDPKKPGSTLSMGYGFVGFKDKKSAEMAMGSISGFVLDGHELSAKFAQRGAEDDAKSASLGPGAPKTPTTKMIVKNLPFEATKKDVQTLFSAHGQLKSVRLPKKFNSGSRGFAFLEFISHKEALNAYNALKHTHLLGRHVVLEWAEDNGAGGDLSILRERVKVGYGDGKDERPGRKRKLDMDVLGGAGEEEDDFVAV